MGSLIDSLQGRTAKAINRSAARLDREAGHQADAASDVHPLLARLLGIAHHDVFDFFGIDATALD